VNKRLPFRHLLSHSLDSRWTTALDFFASKSRTLSRIFSPQRPSLRKVLSLILTLGLTASLPSGLTSLTSIAELHASVDLEPRRGSRDSEIRQLDNLSALWSYNRHRYILDGRVVSWDEQAITTSKGQGYAMGLHVLLTTDSPQD
jgi:hypothetical protein